MKKSKFLRSKNLLKSLKGEEAKGYAQSTVISSEQSLCDCDERSVVKSRLSLLFPYLHTSIPPYLNKLLCNLFCRCRFQSSGVFGFTLIELVITIAVVVILSTISVPLYKDYLWNAKMTEGYSLLAKIRDAQLQYYSEYEYFLHCYSESTLNNGAYPAMDTHLNVDARTNKYFKYFNISDPSRNQGKYRFQVILKANGIGGINAINLIYDLTSGATYWMS